MRFHISGQGVRARSIALVSLWGATAVLAACGGGDKATGPPGGGGPPPDVWSSVAQRTWTVPGATEAYECHTELVSSDEYFTGFRLSSPVAAQTELYLLMRPTVSQVGDYGCGEGDILGGEAIYVAGPGTTPLAFTGGKGVHVASGQYLLLVVHINNTSSSDLSASTIVEGRVVAAKDVTTPMDMFLAGRLDLDIPADGSSVVENGSCDIENETHLVASVPLMRALGTHFTLTVTGPSLETNVFDSSFDPQHVIYSSLTSDFDALSGFRINVSCTFVNNTGFVVNNGESARDESCLAGTYRYPLRPPTSVSPVDCAMLHPI